MPSQWLARGFGSLRLSLVKFIFATGGSNEQLVQNLRDFRQHAIARWKTVETVMVPYFERNEPFPDRTHINVLAALLQLETARLQATWADRAIDEAEKRNTPSELQEHDSTLAELKAEIAAGAP